MVIYNDGFTLDQNVFCPCSLHTGGKVWVDVDALQLRPLIHLGPTDRAAVHQGALPSVIGII